MDEEKYAKLRSDVSALIAHWHRLAAHAKQAPLPRKIISDLAGELQRVVDRNS